MDRIKFTIPGEPCAKGRPRFTNTGRAYTQTKTVYYENLVKLAYAQAAGSDRFDDDAELMITINAFFQIPKSASKTARTAMLNGSKRPTKRPDADNLAKIVMDALNGVAYKDDAAIVTAIISKDYTDSPRVEVEIRRRHISWTR